jgi:hypothetical protein
MDRIIATERRRLDAEGAIVAAEWVRKVEEGKEKA